MCQAVKIEQRAIFRRVLIVGGPLLVFDSVFFSGCLSKCKDPLKGAMSLVESPPHNGDPSNKTCNPSSKAHAPGMVPGKKGGGPGGGPGGPAISTVSSNPIGFTKIPFRF